MSQTRGVHEGLLGQLADRQRRLGDGNETTGLGDLDERACLVLASGWGQDPLTEQRRDQRRREPHAGGQRSGIDLPRTGTSDRWANKLTCRWAHHGRGDGRRKVPRNDGRARYANRGGVDVPRSEASASPARTQQECRASRQRAERR